MLGAAATPLSTSLPLFAGGAAMSAAGQHETNTATRSLVAAIGNEVARHQG
jgi:hypothetical protein